MTHSELKIHGTSMYRNYVPEMDALLGKPFDVLDRGFVKVIDYMGNDASIVQAARVSYGRGTKSVSEDRGLIRHLMRNRHTTPFEMCEIKLMVKVPMDHWRQWIRHRTANVNEYSTRYSEAIDEKQTTDPAEWRSQAKSNKQGSGDFLDISIGTSLTSHEEEFHLQAKNIYEHRLRAGVAREQARKDLPLSTYTEAYWKIDLHNLFNFLSLRMDSHAQKEIRDYATVIGERIVSQWVPLAWEAFEDFRLGGAFLTKLDLRMITYLNAARPARGENYADVTPEWFERKNGKFKRSGERDECAAKLKRLGFEVPWEGE